MKKISISCVFTLVVLVGQAQFCPDGKHPHAIDLGLPSGTKWACCNVGANKPEECGAYFAFGETEEKEIYNEKNYKLKNTRFQDRIIVARSDVTFLKWGQSWRMPLVDLFQELIDNCTSEWKVVNGVNGRVYTGKNGNSIFLPAGGKIINFVPSSDKLGCYWTSVEVDSDHGNFFFFSSDSAGKTTGLKYQGLLIRPINNNM